MKKLMLILSVLFFAGCSTVAWEEYDCTGIDKDFIGNWVKDCGQDKLLDTCTETALVLFCKRSYSSTITENNPAVEPGPAVAPESSVNCASSAGSHHYWFSECYGFSGDARNECLEAEMRSCMAGIDYDTEKEAYKERLAVCSKLNLLTFKREESSKNE